MYFVIADGQWSCTSRTKKARRLFDSCRVSFWGIVSCALSKQVRFSFKKLSLHVDFVYALLDRYR